MNEAINIVFSYCFGNTLCAFDMHILEGEVPMHPRKIDALRLSTEQILSGIISSDKVENHIGVPDTLFK